MLAAHRAAFAVRLALSSPVHLIARLAARRDPTAPLQGRSKQVAAALHAMTSQPVPLQRPVVVLAGYRAWPLMAETLRGLLIRATSGDPRDVLAVSYTNMGFTDQILAHARREISRWRPDVASGDTELDVVGISMGGIVGRALAAAEFGDRALRIRRIFSLATPHRGAKIAERFAPDPAAKDLRPGSDLLARLDARLPRAAFELVPYAVLNDTWVGATRTAPPKMHPIWTPGARVISHFTVSETPGIIADIARRLRSEPTLAATPSPPPRD